VIVSLRTHAHGSGTALDVLEAEDLELRRIFTGLQATRGPSVEERAAYVDFAKEAIRHLATREAALVDVARVAGSDAALHEVSEQLKASMHERRPLIDRVEKMSRGVQGINLRVGQDFESDMDRLVQIVGTEIEWDLGRGVPEIRARLRGTEHEAEFKKAGHVESHAPTNLSPEGPRWWEHAPILSRLITIYDRLRDFPRATKVHR
jgi:hypothetical protein